jgi:hypothetical protein
MAARPKRRPGLPAREGGTLSQCTADGRPSLLRNHIVRPAGGSLGANRSGPCTCLNLRFLVRNIAIVSDFAQTGGRRIAFNQSGLAEDAIIAVRLDPGLLPACMPGVPMRDFLSAVKPGVQ